MTEENKVTYEAVLKDGTKVKIAKDAHHYRAHNAAGVQVGQPYVSLGSLLDAIGGRLPGEKGPTAQVKEPKADGTGKPVEALAGEAELADGTKLEITYDKYHYRAYKKYSNKPAERVGGAFTKVNALLLDIKATAASVAPEPQKPPQAAAPALTPAAGLSADVTQCGQHRAGDCAIDNKKCDGLCGEHASRATEKAADKQPEGGEAKQETPGDQNPPPGKAGADGKKEEKPGGIKNLLGLGKKDK